LKDVTSSIYEWIEEEVHLLDKKKKNAKLFERKIKNWKICC
jgi:hypothetical protein